MKNQTRILTLVKKLIIKILRVKLVTLLEYQNTKTVLQKIALQIGLKKILWLKKLKNTLLRTYVIKNFNDKEFIATFYEKVSQKPDQQYFRIEKVIKRKANKICAE